MHLKGDSIDKCTVSDDVMCVCPQGDFTWNRVSGCSVGLKPVPLQSLSELERVRLKDVAFRRLLRDRDLGCHITIPKCNKT